MIIFHNRRAALFNIRVIGDETGATHPGTPRASGTGPTFGREASANGRDLFISGSVSTPGNGRQNRLLAQRDPEVT
jgi:hypothetical protein